MAASLKVGDTLNGRYPILGILGEGGMGAVYKASDLSSTRYWAIKEMTENFASDRERQEAMEDFERESKLLSELDHPNLPRITHFFSDKGHQYLVMDLVEGQTWAKIQSQKKQSISEILDIVCQIAEVLEYLHNRPQPIIFRDLKPANVMITPQGVAKLIDFGIARVFKDGKAKDTKALGTPGYAAPEQYGTGQSDARTDIYALGVMMHEAFTGVDPSLEPFKFSSISSLKPDFPEALASIVHKAIAINREERYESIAELRKALNELHKNPNVYDFLPLRLKTGVLPKPKIKGFVPKILNINGLEKGTTVSKNVTLSGEVCGSIVSDQDWLKVIPKDVDGSDVPLTVTVDSTGLEAGNYAGELTFEDESLQVRFEVLAPKAGCWPWVFIVSLLLTSFIPWAGIVAALLAWIVVIMAPAQRSIMIVFSLAIAVSSLLSTIFGTVAFKYLVDFCVNLVKSWQGA